MISLGIDIGGTSIKAALLRDGAVAWTGKSAPYSRPNTPEIVTAIADLIAGCRDEPQAIGLCCPGIFDAARRMVTLAVNVPGLVGVGVDEILGDAIAAARQGSMRILPRACVISDANATAYDLYQSHQLTGRMFCLTIGTGVGASVVDDGMFLRVSGETPGHFGQLDVSLSDDPPIGPDGGAGSLEAYIGAAALARRYGTSDWINQIDSKDDAMRALVRAIRIAHAIYRPAHVAMAGGVGIRLGKCLAEIEAAVKKDLSRIARPGWQMLIGDSDYHAACGAARFAASEKGK